MFLIANLIGFFVGWQAAVYGAAKWGVGVESIMFLIFISVLYGITASLIIGAIK